MKTRAGLITIALAVVLLLTCLAGTALAGGPAYLSGSITFSTTTFFPQGVIIADDAVLSAPSGDTLTMTVNGVETGQKLVTTAGVTTSIIPGAYMGKVVFTPTVIFDIFYQSLHFPLRQALYVDGSGINWAKSVQSALVGGTVSSTEAKNVKVTSTGECFDAFVVNTGGTYKLTNVKINMTGNGRSDFIGYGAGIVGQGAGTTLVVDGATITNTGVARVAVVANGGANVIVKNSTIKTYSGTIPADYMPTINLAQMRSVPWMLSLSGNVRATNLLGVNTRAAYINSYVSSNGWGVLSTDGCTTPQLNVINSTIAANGKDGYGTYGIGNAYERFLGTTFNVATMAVAAKGCYLWFGDSDPVTVSQLNTQYSLGLTAKELKSIKSKHTTVSSGRFGIMWHGGGGTMDVSGGTVFNTDEAVIMDKGQSPKQTVDGSQGAKLISKNGVIMQIMDDDDPGPQPPNMYCNGIFNDPDQSLVPTKNATFDVTDTTTANSYASLALSNIKLTGNFYNSMGWTGNHTATATGLTGKKNMYIALSNAKVTGMITATRAHHVLSHIEYPVGWSGSAPFINTGHENDYEYLENIVNTPYAVINNGVIVSLANASKWTVTGTCYLSKLVLDSTSSIVPLVGHTLSMTVDGTATAIAAGTFTGAITITLN